MSRWKIKMRLILGRRLLLHWKKRTAKMLKALNNHPDSLPTTFGRMTGVRLTQQTATDLETALTDLYLWLMDQSSKIEDHLQIIWLMDHS